MKKVKMILAVLMGLSVMLTGCGTSSSTNETDTKTATESVAESTTETDQEDTLQAEGAKVGMVVNNLGTQSYSDDVNNGLTNAKERLGIVPIVLEVSSVTEVENSYRTLISQGCKLIIVPIEDYTDAMEKLASEYKDVTFIYTQAIFEGYDNIISMSYRENEAAFLGGALAASMTQTNKLGVVLAVTSDVQNRYLSGFSAGAKAVNPDVEIQSAYTNSFADVNLGLETASVMYQKGCDIVATYAGACNLGVFNAAEKAGEGKYSLGAATGQFDKSPDKILASVVKPIDEGLVTIIKDYFDGNIDSKSKLSLGVKEDGVGLKWTTNTELLDQIPEEVVGTIDDLKNKVMDGTIVVPTTQEELDAFDYTYSK